MARQLVSPQRARRSTGPHHRLLAGALAAVCLWVAATHLEAGGISVAAAGGRTWHVAPKELVGIPPKMQIRTLADAAQKVEPGDVVLIHDGIYRESVTIGRSGTAEKPITFQAAPGEHVVITGADRLEALKKEDGPDNIFSAPWRHHFPTHPNNDHHRLVGRCEQVIVGGYQLWQVLDREHLSRGTFFADLDAKRLHLWSRDNADLTKRVLVEASVRSLLWQCQGDHVRLRGVQFRYAANPAQHGAAEFKGNDNTIEDCVFQEANGCGAGFRGQRLTVRRCTFQENGQMGFGAGRAHDLLLTGCNVRNNNSKGFGRGWEAGGDKICLSRHAVLEKSIFTGNRGNGIWFDIGNEACEVRNCLIADNEDAGIFYEISYGLHAHDNVILGNGFAATPGGWGAAAGIALSSSPNCVIERNLLVGNKEGFNFREQNRATPRIDDRSPRWVWNHDQLIRHNVCAYNRDAQTWGWFDLRDGRHWPAAMQSAEEKEAGRTVPHRAAGDKADRAQGAPLGLTLESLKLTMEDNFYAAQPYQGFFNWGAPWRRNQRYGSLDDVRRTLKLESGSQAGAVRFADFLTRDFRVPSDSPLLKLGCYPKGEVPGVVLGTF